MGSLLIDGRKVRPAFDSSSVIGWFDRVWDWRELFSWHWRERWDDLWNFNHQISCPKQSRESCRVNWIVWRTAVAVVACVTANAARPEKTITGRIEPMPSAAPPDRIQSAPRPTPRIKESAAQPSIIFLFWSGTLTGRVSDPRPSGTVFPVKLANRRW